MEEEEEEEEEEDGPKRYGERGGMNLVSIREGEMCGGVDGFIVWEEEEEEEEEEGRRREGG